MISKFCPVCKNKNDSDAATCAYCGAPFRPAGRDPITTVPVLGAQPEVIVKSPQQLEERAKYPADALLLFIMDEEQPLVLKSATKIVLGRNVAESSSTILDLAKYGAGELGVSRQHAVIIPTGNAYTLCDLGSTNGTWLNASRLTPQKSYPLHSGDQVRLGSLRLTVYFGKGEESASGFEEFILLVEESQSSAILHPRLTAAYLAASINPYLKAIGDLQAVIDECQGQPPHDVFINTISATRQDLPIGVSLSGASLAIRLIKDHISPWRQRHSISLSEAVTDKLRPLENREANNSPHHSPLPDAVANSGTAIVPATLKRTEELRQTELLQLAQELVANIAPALSTTEIEAQAIKLLRPLRVLAIGRLQILADKSK